MSDWNRRRVVFAGFKTASGLRECVRIHFAHLMAGDFDPYKPYVIGGVDPIFETAS
jgi:hypothetical protein